METISSHGWRRLTPFHWDEDSQTLERVEHLSTGEVVQLQIRADERQILIDVDGGDESEILSLVRRMLQLDLPIDQFHAYCLTRPELAHIPTAVQGRMLRGSSLFEDAVKVIATSNTTWTQTIAMTDRLAEHFGSPLPSAPERRAFPTAQQIAAVPFDEFAALARMGYRNAYVHKIATDIAGGALDIEAWQDESQTADALRKRLLSLPGVGPYGAACLMLYLGKPAHVNVDSWARTLLGKELGRPVTDKEVYAYFEQYGEWRGLVYNFYPWKKEDNA
ncbi:MAG: N-glycosylase/DNA lyase [Capsulimonas sp.]|nr:N-glycosylase/DNA lyase [Capsulimonas sp.]